jgi:inosine-uridine nucleoside N-ribohydrolase
LPGNTDIDNGKTNILKLYKSLDEHIKQHPQDAARFPNFHSRTKPILAVNTTMTFEDDVPHTAAYYHGFDGLGNISERYPDILPHETSDSNSHPYLQLTNESAVDVVLKLLKERGAKSINYVALAPLTTLAFALQKDESVTDLIGRVICMGYVDKAHRCLYN